MVCSDQPLENARLTPVERGLDVSLQPEGRFAIVRLEAGDDTLEVSVDGEEPPRCKITVPSRIMVLRCKVKCVRLVSQLFASHNMR